MKELIQFLDREDVLTIAKETFLDIFNEDAYSALVLKKSNRKSQIIKESFCFILKKGYNIPTYIIAEFLQVKEDTATSYVQKYPNNSRYLSDEFSDSLEEFYDLFEKRIVKFAEENSSNFIPEIDEEIIKCQEALENNQGELRRALEAQSRAFKQLEKIKSRLHRIDMRISKAEELTEKNKMRLNQKIKAKEVLV